MEFSLRNWMEEGGEQAGAKLCNLKHFFNQQKCGSTFLMFVTLCMSHLPIFTVLTLTLCHWIQQFSQFYIPFFETWYIPSGLVVKNLPAIQEAQETRVQSRGWEDPLEQEMASHSSILAWKIPWTEAPGGATVGEVAKSGTRLNTLAYISLMSNSVTFLSNWFPGFEINTIVFLFNYSTILYG